MKEQIIKLLDNVGDIKSSGKRAKYNVKPLDEIEIHKRLKEEYDIDLSEVCNLIRELEKKGEIYRTKSGKFTLYKFTNLKIGRISVNKKGFGFVIMDDGPDIKILEENMNGAIHNDVVAIDMLENSIEQGKVVKILERSLNVVVGEYSNDLNIGAIKIDNSKMKLKIIIDEKDRNNAMPGHKVLVEPYEKINDNTYKGKVIEILGHKNDPGVDILSIAYENEIDNKFSKEAIDEANALPKKVRLEDIADREDKREELVVTIDGNDAKDFDDAISIKILENGNYLLTVYIADVDAYIKEGSALYKDALSKGTSSYLVNTVMNMFPEVISNGICSLNPNEDRLVVAFEMEIDKNGRTVSDRVYKSVINSKKRMTYENVNRLFDGEKIEDYEPYKEMLNSMKDLSRIIRKSKEQRGSIDFDIPEIRIEVDELGNPISIGIRERGEAERVIEDFMIKANETGAELAFNFVMPFLYRTHEKAKKEKLAIYIDILNALGFRIKADLKRINSKMFQNIVKQIKEHINNNVKDEKYKKILFEVISETGLRSMPKAIYSTDELIGHFGLASTRYAQCTSPIRRFPDLVNQNILKRMTSGEEITIEELKELKEKLVYIAEHCSTKERNAIQCERDVEDMKTAEYMKNHIGEEYKGIVSSVIPSGMFIRLDNLIEGFVRISDLDNDYYIFDEKGQYFIGKRTKKRYQIGTQLNVKVIAASKEEKTIDFETIKTLKKDSK